MNEVEFADLGGGRFRVCGRLSFETAHQALEASRPLFADHDQLDLDLQGVEAADSAGLALLIEWVSWAHRQHKGLSYRNLPDQLWAVARLGEVESLLPVVSEGEAGSD